MLTDCLDIGGLGSRAGRDASLAGAEPGVLAPQAEALVVALGLRQPERRLDRGAIDLLTALQAFIKARQCEAGDFGSRGRAGNRQPVAARHQRHAELALDAVEMLVALAVKRRQQ